MQNNYGGFQNNNSNNNMLISNINYNSNGGSQNNNLNFQNLNMTQTQYIPTRSTKKLYVKLTQDEQNMFSKIYKYLDPQSKGRIDGKPAADFMKRSNLDKFTLKNIWLIAAQTNNKFLEREELFVALRLIALAQNNMPVSEKSIEMNYPIPPLPKFNRNGINNNINNNNNIINNNNNIYEITEKEKMLYKNIFDNNKENNDERIKAHNAILIWKENNASDETIKTVAKIINPLEIKGFFNLREFQVASHMVSISNQCALPQKLPDNLLIYLGRDFINNMNTNNNLNNGNNDNHFNTNNSISRLTTIQKTNSNFLDESQFSALNRQLLNASSYNTIYI